MIREERVGIIILWMVPFLLFEYVAQITCQPVKSVSLPFYTLSGLVSEDASSPTVRGRGCLFPIFQYKNS
jgi:hypothetical protein